MALLRAPTAGLVACAITATIFSSAAVAQDFDSEIFRAPSAGDQNLLSVQSARMMEPRRLAIGFQAGYADDPLVAVDMENGRRVADVVGTRVGAELSAAYSFDNIEIYGAIPFVVFQDSSADPQAMLPLQGETSGLGDVRVGSRWRFYGEPIGVALALSGELTLPTSFGAELAGDEQLQFAPRIIAEVRGPRAFIAINVGARLRDRQDFGDLGVGSAFAYGIGAAVPLPFSSSTTLIAELSGEVAGTSSQESPVELRGGLRWTGDQLAIALGYGRGVARGYGAPDHRGLVMVNYRFGDLTPKVEAPKAPVSTDPDPDRDGIVGSSDDCPKQAEDYDGYLDLDGCPEPDNDEDSVLDTKDMCRDTPEDIDGYRDEDGCPDPDNDGDGIADEVDECPNDQEIINGVNDTDGCPDAGDQLVVIGADKLITNRKIEFRPGGAELTASSQPVIEQMVLILKRTPELKKIRIEGHTDDVGGDDNNLRLSRRRADAVRDALIAGGVEAVRLESKGYGETRPIEDNTTPAGRSANRRVDFIIVERAKPETESRGAKQPKGGAK